VRVGCTCVRQSGRVIQTKKQRCAHRVNGTPRIEPKQKTNSMHTFNISTVFIGKGLGRFPGVSLTERTIA